MENNLIYEDIAIRTGGDVYIGVVGPVRTGKSTFIKRFMELMVLPNIKDIHESKRAQDELPQSGGGKTIMTTEPKFIPAEAVEIGVAQGIDVRVRMVDCVGYAVAGALGFNEETGPRMVNTPWFDEAIPFEEAAEIGTRKVITDHSTIGMVIVTDGSITGIQRENYLEAEIRVIAELKELDKPFLILLNTTNPESEEAINICNDLSLEHNVATLPINVATMGYEDVLNILKESLYEFPVTEVNVSMPRYIYELDEKHYLRNTIEENIRATVGEVRRIRDIERMVESLYIEGITKNIELVKMELGTGSANIYINLLPHLLYEVLGEFAGVNIEGEHDLVRIVKDFSKAHHEWSKVEEAMREARDGGYGVITPRLDEMYLEEPELIKQGGRFGVRLKASAPSFHVIRASISTEITPLIGTEKQCEELVKYILNEFEDDPTKIWETNIFGKSLNELVSEGIQGKLYRMPDNAQVKLQETLQRIVNEGGGGLICIIL